MDRPNHLSARPPKAPPTHASSRRFRGPTADAAPRPEPTGDRVRSLATRLQWRPALAIFVLAVMATAAFAADDNKIIFPASAGKTEAPAAAPGGSTSTVTLVLALVLAAVGAWMVWRNRRGPGVARDSRNLSVEETRSLGNRQYLVVASYEGKKFLLGVCPGRIDMLAPLNERRPAGESE